MSAFAITVPDAASLPTTMVKLVSALRGIVVELAIEGEETPAYVQIRSGWERPQGALVSFHPWRDDEDTVDYAVVRTVPLSTVTAITVV